jgi:hypothetical protein
MYHRFVKSKVHTTFALITAGNWEPMVKAMAPRFSYHFYGDSALSGERHTTEAVRRWWERSFRLIPSATFDVLDWDSRPAFQASPVIDAAWPPTVSPGPR